MPFRETTSKRSKRVGLFCLLCGLWLAGQNSGPWAVVNAQGPVAGNDLRPWDEYRVIMWIGDSAGQHRDKFPLFLERLREMGVNTAMVYGGADPKPFVDAKFPYYVENIVNRGLCLRWNSKVRDWDKFVEGWRKTRTKDAFVRDYCLDDPKWLDYAKNEIGSAARRNRPHQPLAFCIRDELSITISANPFDYDYSPAALTGFRAWLKTQYKDVDALNRAWETRFGSWEEVKPFSTDEIKNRMASGEALPRGQPDWQAVQKLRFDPVLAVSRNEKPTRWNFSPWCDFRTYMDISLARTLGQLRQAAREVDPHTPVGIEGTQMPHAFGGYDLYRLSQVLDWVEPYDVCNSRDHFRLVHAGQTDALHHWRKGCQGSRPAPLASAARRRSRLHHLVERRLHRLEKQRSHADPSSEGPDAGAQGDAKSARQGLPSGRARF